MLLERRHAVTIEARVDPQLVRAQRRRAWPRLAEVDVEPPVAIDVGDRDPGRPRAARARRVPRGAVTSRNAKRPF